MYRRRSRNSQSPYSSSSAFIVTLATVMAIVVVSVVVDVRGLIIVVMLVLGAAVAIAVGFLWYHGQQETCRLRALAISDIDRMSGIEFEHYLGEVLKSRGFMVSYTRVTGDFGTDI